MFGYVTVYPKALSKEAQDRYQAYYCGLCRSLGRYGAAAQLSLSFDLSFTAALLSALYEPATVFRRGRCLPHPLRSRPRAGNEFLDYAADMTVVLAYYNDLDDWQDDSSHAARRHAGLLEKHLPGIRARWPRQCGDIRRCLDELNALEKAGSHDLDALCGAFGGLLGSVLSCRDDEWRGVLERMGRGLGGFIYLMDAYDDLEKDTRKHRYNALSQLAAELPAGEFEQRCQEYLTQQMGLCAQSFDLLPILKDTPEGENLYNRIYSGVWSKYALVKNHREGRTNHD